MCVQRRFRSACAFAQTDQKLHQPHFRKPRMQSFFMWTTKTLIRLRGCAGWSESLLGTHVRRSISDIAAHLFDLSQAHLYHTQSWELKLFLGRSHILDPLDHCIKYTTHRLKNELITTNEPQRKKTYFLTCVRPTKTLIRLRVRAAWSVFVVSMEKIRILGYPKYGQWRFR